VKRSLSPCRFRMSENRVVRVVQLFNLRQEQIRERRKMRSIIILPYTVYYYGYQIKKVWVVGA